MWNITKAKTSRFDNFLLKAKALIHCPFNSKNRKALRKELKTKKYLLKFPFHCDENFDAAQIPIYIISFNQLSYLKQMIAQLERHGLKNIHIINNKSTYEPLLQYLEDCPYTVHHMDKNYGHTVFWTSGKFDDVIENSLYVVTDPDIEFNDSLPLGFMKDLYRLLGEHPFVSKAGFALKISDLPDTEFGNTTKKWEKQFWEVCLPDPLEAYLAAIDTTFALYRPGNIMSDFYSGIRVAGVFTSRHLPFYHFLDQDAESLFYLNTANASGSMARYQRTLLAGSSGKDV
ncbi:hypothetical protein [uncultured Mailhella sp.]|uniref:hypothetical protein n=1 Tax=uncultured Mailhella sp. TaxID=1981031 RepID=UPI002601FFF3|nr:hypothetical protein [uncultured Mailhella sp.]